MSCLTNLSCLSLLASGAGLLMAGPINVGGSPLVDPALFRITTFATGLSYPTSMAALPDGSILVGVTEPTGGFGTIGYDALATGAGRLLRFTDINNDGIADGPGTIVASLDAAVLSVRTAGNLVIAATAGNGSDPGSKALDIVIFQPGASPTDSYTNLGSLNLTLDAAALPGSIALAVRAAPGQPGSYELFFAIPAGSHDGTPIGSVALAGLASAAALPPGSVFRLVITPSSGSGGGGTVTVSAPTLVATGVRVSAGLSFASDGSLLISDNGYQSYDTGDQISADELNRLSAATIAAGSSFLGYESNYPDYATGAFVGGAGVAPLAAFIPIPGSEARGATEVTQAPAWFPNGLDAGYLVGFHGLWDAVGASNPINPVYWVDPVTGAYFPFIAGGQSGVGHLNGLLSTGNGFFLSDLFTVSTFTAGSGAIYMLAPADDPFFEEVPEPASLTLVLIAAAAAVAAAKKFNSKNQPRSAD